MTTPASAARTPVARLSGPAELAAALPQLCGFVPQESLVVVALHGPRHRVRLTMRFDLPPPAHDEALVAEAVERVLCSGAGAALVLLCTDAPDDHDLPRSRLVRRLRAGLRAAGLGADDALLVRGGRWWSYACRDRRCCPPGGTPLQGQDGSTALTLVASANALDGRAVLASRDDLVRSLAPPAPSGQVLEALAEARARRQDRLRREGRGQVGRAALAAWRTALRAGPSVAPALDHAVALVAALDDSVVRDEVLAAGVDDSDALLSLLLQLVAVVPPPHDATSCALLAWLAHVRGDGALANVALDRALASDPGCTLARLSREALDQQVEPAELRAVLVRSRRVLHAAHPWSVP